MVAADPAVTEATDAANEDQVAGEAANEDQAGEEAEEGSGLRILSKKEKDKLKKEKEKVNHSFIPMALVFTSFLYRPKRKRRLQRRRQPTLMSRRLLFPKAL